MLIAYFVRKLQILNKVIIHPAYMLIAYFVRKLQIFILKKR